MDQFNSRMILDTAPDKVVMYNINRLEKTDFGIISRLRIISGY